MSLPENLAELSQRSLQVLRNDGLFVLLRRMAGRLAGRAPIPIDYETWVRGHVPARPSSQPPRILVQTHDLSLSGVPIIAHDLSVDLATTHFVAAVSAVGGEILDAYGRAGIAALVDPRILQSPERAVALLQPFDLLMANTVMAARLVLVAKSLGLSILWIIQEGDFGVDLARRRRELRDALAAANQIVFASQQTLAKYRAVCPDIKATSILFGVEPPASLARRATPADGMLRIVHIGSVERRKGQDVLVDAVRSLPPEIARRLEVTFVGRTIERRFQRRLLAASRDLGNVHWPGGLTREETWRRLAESDVLVCSSRDETGPLVVYEAMSLGKAVVSTPVGAVPEIIEDGVNGRIFPPDDAGRLGAVLAELSREPAVAAGLGAAAEATATRRLTRRRSSDAIAALVSQLLTVK
jgi:glycosyltransferase involved in cell wall biosynthesis